MMTIEEENKLLNAYIEKVKFSRNLYLYDVVCLSGSDEKNFDFPKFFQMLQQGEFSTDKKISDFVQENYKEFNKDIRRKLAEKIKETTKYTLEEQGALSIKLEELPSEKRAALINGISNYLDDFYAKYDKNDLKKMNDIHNKIEGALAGREGYKIEEAQTELMIAISKGDLKEVTSRLSALPHAAFIDRYGQSPITLAVEVKRYDVVDLLVNEGGVSLKDEKTAQSVFQLLLSQRHEKNGFSVERLNHLLDLGLNPSVEVEGMTPLKHMIKYGSSKDVEKVLAKRVTVDENINSFFEEMQEREGMNLKELALKKELVEKELLNQKNAEEKGDLKMVEDQIKTGNSLDSASGSTVESETPPTVMVPEEQVKDDDSTVPPTVRLDEETPTDDQEMAKYIQLHENLITAAFNGNLNAVKDLLSKKADINWKNESDKKPTQTALTVACLSKTNNSDEMVDLLIKRGADVNKADGFNQMPLLVAAATVSPRALRKVKLLIEAGADIHYQDEKKDTALTIASCCQPVEMINFLIEKGLDVNHQREDGETALMRAAMNKNEGVVSALTKAGADVNAQDNEGKTALMHGVNLKNSAYVKALLDNNARLDIKNNDGQTVFEYASELAKTYDQTPEYQEIKQLIVDHMLIQAAKSNDHKGIKEALAKGANNDPKNPVYQDVKQTLADYMLIESVSGIVNVENIKKALEQGANIDVKDPIDNRTCLMYCALLKKTEPLKFLIENGADVNLTDDSGRTALMIAMDTIRSGFSNKYYEDVVKTVSMLVDAGTDLTIESKYGKKTALSILDEKISKKEISDEIGTKLKEILSKQGETRNSLDNSIPTPTPGAPAPQPAPQPTPQTGPAPAPQPAPQTGPAPVPPAPQAAPAPMDNPQNQPIMASATVNTDGITDGNMRQLFIDVGAGDVENVKKHVNSRVDLNIKNKEGFTVAHYAAMNGNIDVLKAMSYASLPINAQNNLGQTPVMLALQNGNWEAARHLIKDEGAKVSTVDKNGFSVLDYYYQGLEASGDALAAQNKSADIFGHLLASGVKTKEDRILDGKSNPVEKIQFGMDRLSAIQLALIGSLIARDEFKSLSKDDILAAVQNGDFATEEKISNFLSSKFSELSPLSPEFRAAEGNLKSVNEVQKTLNAGKDLLLTEQALNKQKKKEKLTLEEEAVLKPEKQKELAEERDEFLKGQPNITQAYNRYVKKDPTTAEKIADQVNKAKDVVEKLNADVTFAGPESFKDNFDKLDWDKVWEEGFWNKLNSINGETCADLALNMVLTLCLGIPSEMLSKYYKQKKEIEKKNKEIQKRDRMDYITSELKDQNISKSAIAAEVAKKCLRHISTPDICLQGFDLNDPNIEKKLNTPKQKEAYARYKFWQKVPKTADGQVDWNKLRGDKKLFTQYQKYMAKFITQEECYNYIANRYRLHPNKDELNELLDKAAGMSPELTKEDKTDSKDTKTLESMMPRDLVKKIAHQTADFIEKNNQAALASFPRKANGQLNYNNFSDEQKAFYEARIAGYLTTPAMKQQLEQLLTRPVTKDDLVKVAMSVSSYIFVDGFQQEELEKNKQLNQALTLIKANDKDGLKAMLPGMDINHQLPGGETLLFSALKLSLDDKVGNTQPLDKEMIEMLVNAGADLNIENQEGKTALDLAQAQASKPEMADIIALLKQKGAQNGSNGGKPQPLPQRQTSGPTPTPTRQTPAGPTPPPTPARPGAPAPVNSAPQRQTTGPTPPPAPTRPGAPTPAQPQNQQAQNQQEFQQRLQQGLNIGLRMASRDGKLGEVKKLLANGADVNAQNNLGQTPVMIAIMRGQLSIVEELLKHNPDLNIKSNKGNTAENLIVQIKDEGIKQQIKNMLDQYKNKGNGQDKGKDQTKGSSLNNNIQTGGKQPEARPAPEVAPAPAPEVTPAPAPEVAPAPAPEVTPGQPKADDEKAKDGQPTAEGEKAKEGQPTAEGEKAKDGQPTAEGEKAKEGQPTAEGEKAKDGQPKVDGEKAKEGQPKADDEKAPGTHYADQDMIMIDPQTGKPVALDPSGVPVFGEELEQAPTPKEPASKGDTGQGTDGASAEAGANVTAEASATATASAEASVEAGTRTGSEGHGSLANAGASATATASAEAAATATATAGAKAKKTEDEEFKFTEDGKVVINQLKRTTFGEIKLMTDVLDGKPLTKDQLGKLGNIMHELGVQGDIDKGSKAHAGAIGRLEVDFAKERAGADGKVEQVVSDEIRQSIVDLYISGSLADFVLSGKAETPDEKPDKMSEKEWIKRQIQIVATARALRQKIEAEKNRRQELEQNKRYLAYIRKKNNEMSNARNQKEANIASAKLNERYGNTQ